MKTYNVMNMYKATEEMTERINEEMQLRANRYFRRNFRSERNAGGRFTLLMVYATGLLLICLQLRSLLG